MCPFVAGRTDGIGEAENDTAVQHVGHHGDEQHQHHGDEQPIEDERQERQVEDVEPDIGAELGICDTERLAVAEQQPRLPLRRRRQSDDHRQHAGREVAEEPEPVPEQLVEPLDVRVDVRREAARGQLVGDEKVEPGQEGEGAEEDAEERHLGAQHAPEDVRPPEPVVPQEVDVEARQRPPEDDDDQEQHPKGDEDRPTRDAPTRATATRQI